MTDSDETIEPEDEGQELDAPEEFSSEDKEFDFSAADNAFPLIDSSNGLVRYDPLERYLAEIRHLPQLSREEEHALAIRYHEHGDQRAGYKLVMANLRLVVIIAREFQRNFKNILDLIQEGNIGLLEAVKKFDPYKETRFPSYAAYWVRAYMLRYIINNIRLVKIGTTQAQRKLFYNLRKEKAKLEAEGFIPEAKLLAKRLNVKESEVVEMEQRLMLPDLSVDAPLGDGINSADYHSVIPDDAASVEDTVADEEFSAKLQVAMDEFKEHADEKEKMIIERRLFTEEPATLQEIADEFGLSRERIRQLESRLKDRLKVFIAQRLQLGDDGEVSLVED